MDKIEYRVVIKFLTLEGSDYKAIHERLLAVYGSAAPSLSTVSFWTREFKRGRQSLEDEERSGRPSTSMNEDNVSAVEKIVLANRRVTVEDISSQLNISVGSVHAIIHDELHMNKVHTKWVPRILSSDMRQTRIDCSKELLQLCESNPSFFDRLVTGDECWVHFYDPESPHEAREWKRSGSPVRHRPRPLRSGGKLLMTVFWDRQGIILTDFLSRGRTMNGEYYGSLIEKLREAIKERRRGL